MIQTQTGMNAANPRPKAFRRDETRPKRVLRIRWLACAGAILALWLIPAIGGAQRQDNPALHFGNCETPGDPATTIRFCSMTIEALAPVTISRNVTVSTYLESRRWLARSYYMRGRARMELGQLNEALGDFDACMSGDVANACSTIVDLKKFRGHVIGELNQNNDALLDLNEYVETFALDAEGLYFRAKVYSQMGNLLNAKRDLETALSHKPDYRPAADLLKSVQDRISHPPQPAQTPDSKYLAEGRKKRASNDLVGAAFAFKRAVRENPDNVNAWVELGEVSDANGSREEAQKSYSKALELQPNNLRARKGQGALYLKTGDFEAARTELSQALLSSPKDTMAIYGRGVANFGLGEFPSAEEDFAVAAGSRGAPIVFSFWTHVARGRTDPGDKSAITAPCGGTQMGAWERHLCDLFLDKASPAEVESYLNSLDAEKEKSERVMGNFFLAEHALQRGEPLEAERFYVAALVAQGFQAIGEQSLVASALQRLVTQNVETGAVGITGTKATPAARKPGVAAASPSAPPPRFLIHKGDKVGFINKLGAIVIPAKFDDVREWSEGLAGFAGPDGKWGAIDTTGKVVLEPKFESIPYFSEGLSAVYVGQKAGFMDKTGKIVVTPRFTGAEHFSEGLSAVTAGPKSGYANKAGRLVVPPVYDEVRNFHEGLGMVKKDQKWGFVDATGKPIIPLQYSGASEFSEGLARVRTSKGDVYIDKTGKVVLEPKVSEARDFSEGLAAVQVDGKWGFIDKTGKMAIPPTFDNASSFHESLAAVGINGKTGFIDKTGKVAIPPEYIEAGDFSDGLAQARTGDDWGYVNKTGKMVWQDEPLKTQ